MLILTRLWTIISIGNIVAEKTFDWKMLPVTNTLAYYTRGQLKVKRLSVRYKSYWQSKTILKCLKTFDNYWQPPGWKGLQVTNSLAYFTWEQLMVKSFC